MCESCRTAIAKGLQVGDRIRRRKVVFSLSVGSVERVDELGSIVSYDGKGLIRSLSEERDDEEHEMLRVRFPDGHDERIPASWCEKEKVRD
jgi:hypothetical protein